VDRFQAQSDTCLITTDDGSFGLKGLVTTALERVLEEQFDVDEVLAIGRW